jgi:hypothetical protein
MSARELDISAIVGSDDFVSFDLSNNRATLGENAGPLTWNASLEAARDIAPPILDTDEKREAFRDFVREAGAWDDEEIAAWDDVELNALCLQWIAGDIREAFGDVEPAAWDWEEYQKDSEAGRVSSRLLKSEDGKIYFYIGN